MNTGKIKDTTRILLAAAVSVLLTLSACAPKQIVRQRPRPLKVAVVLGAGAARGFAHIGVLKVLESNGIPIQMIVGSSAGSLVGSLYAYGYNAYQLQQIALALDPGDIIDLSIPDNGFIKGEKLEGYVDTMVKRTPLERLRLPFYAVATRVPDGREVVFGRGDTGRAVRASCSVPGVFRPVSIGDGVYVDGGVVDPVAVSVARRYGADIIIAVDISADLDTRPPQSTIDTILQSITIMYGKIAAGQLSGADVVIRPKVGKIGPADFDRRNDAIMEGEKAAYAAIPRIKALLDTKGAQGVSAGQNSTGP
jgi:NTE family protein